MKLVPVFCVRLASLADKPERAVVTSTISYNSTLHRRHGVAGQVFQPNYNKQSLGKLFSEEWSGTRENHWGWAKLNLDTTAPQPNGARLATCSDCRLKRLQQLIHGFTQESPACGDCADWDLLTTNKKVSLDFQAHKDYPTRCFAGSPVTPPVGRDSFQAGARLPFVKLTFSWMKQACKFAFYQASRPGKQGNFWGKGKTECCLRHCAIGPKAANALWDSARDCAKHGAQNEVDYFENDRIHNFFFHPSWCASDLEVSDFIETVMHQLGLGVAQSNFELCSMFLADTPQKSGLSSAEFLRSVQPLLGDLKVFLLGWLQAYPFNGSGDSHTTGGWVGENWICYLRLSKFVHAWCNKNPDVASRCGVDDMRRAVNSCHAFVARCLTHSGMDNQFIQETDLHMKEFLSSIAEFDVRVRHGRKAKKESKTKAAHTKVTNQPTKKARKSKAAGKGGRKRKSDQVSSGEAAGEEPATAADREDWCLKANYMALPNLITMMMTIGPLVLWWDGGGKGEKYIQSVKPHIKTGVRGKASKFFTSLLEKLYRVLQLQLLELRYGSKGMEEHVEEKVEDIINELVGSLNLQDEVEDDPPNGSTEERKKVTFSELEEQGMRKTRTIYVYKKEAAARQSLAIEWNKPVAGIVVQKKDNSFEFQIVYRKEGKRFGCRPLLFQDRIDGEERCGMWCSSAVLDEHTEHVFNDFSQVQDAAGMAAVALPLKYVVDKDDPCAAKRYVITNWWKERDRNNDYIFPVLDNMLHRNVPNPEDQELLREASVPPVDERNSPFQPEHSGAI